MKNMRRASVLILLILDVQAFQYRPLIISGWTGTGTGSTTTKTTTSRTTTRRCLYLKNALEYLADERCRRVSSKCSSDASSAATAAAYKRLSWFDPLQPQPQSQPLLVDEADASDGALSSSLSSLETLPLYPLSAVYLPALGVNHTLNNVQPRNLRMALDLAESQDPRFCVTLQALDTGNLACIGAIMRVLETLPQETDGTIVRIGVTCCCEELVRIVRVVNPDAARLENRIKRSDEYLQAQVQPYTHVPLSMDDDPHRSSTSKTHLADDYNAVRSLYLKGVGCKDLPPFALETLPTDFPPLLHDNESLLTNNGTLFWQTAQLWQQLCHTVTAGRQIRLSADRNEYMVEAAMRKGGPLKLPVHMEDLTPADCRQLEQMEIDAQEEWLALRLDACLDFQVLITLEPTERLDFFTSMIVRERQRLEHAAALQQEEVPFLQLSDETILPEPPRKGAWFDDEF